MPIQWSEDLELGVPAIDDQHKALFKAVNELLQGLGQGSGRTAIAPFFVDGVFLERGAAHFAAEEAVMAKHRYPEARDHAAAHTAFQARLAALTTEYAQRGASAALVIASCLQLRELIQHVIDVDHKLGVFLRQRSN